MTTEPNPYEWLVPWLWLGVVAILFLAMGALALFVFKYDDWSKR